MFAGWGALHQQSRSVVGQSGQIWAIREDRFGAGLGGRFGESSTQRLGKADLIGNPRFCRLLRVRHRRRGFGLQGLLNVCLDVLVLSLCKQCADLFIVDPP